MDVVDIIVEKPHGFIVGNKQLYIYPASLGKMLIVSRLMESLGIDKTVAAINPYAEALRVAKGYKNEVCRIIAYHTIENRSEIFDERVLSEREQLLLESMTVEELATILTLILSTESIADITKHLGLDAEARRREKVLKVKKADRNTYTFGGLSIMGALIIPACEKLNMTPRQIVWDVSYRFLKLLMADAMTQLYLTDKERKQCKVSNDRDVINADTPEGMERIKSMNWD